MKKLIVSLLLMAGLTAVAQTNTSTPPVPPELPGQKWIQLIAGAETNDWTFAAAPSYTKDLQDVNGDLKEVGVTIAALYRINDFAKTGLRFDHISGQFFMGSAQAQLQAPLKLWGRPVTPFLTAGVGAPLGAGEDDGEPVLTAGTGIATTLWQTEKYGVGLLYHVERWSNLEGNPTVHHGGLFFNVKF